jgi:hypothetical protein
MTGDPASVGGIVTPYINVLFMENKPRISSCICFGLIPKSQSFSFSYSVQCAARISFVGCYQ